MDPVADPTSTEIFVGILHLCNKLPTAFKQFSNADPHQFPKSVKAFSILRHGPIMLKNILIFKFRVIFRLDRSFVTTRVPNSSLGAARGTIVADNVGFFKFFVEVLPFPQFHSTYILHFSMSSFHHLIHG